MRPAITVSTDMRFSGLRASSALRGITALMIAGCLMTGCTAAPPAATPASTPTAPSASSTARPTPSKPTQTAADYRAMQRQLKQKLTGGAPELKGVRSVLVSVGGQTVVRYYRNRAPDEYAHVWSVTKTVISILVGIAVDEGRLRVDQTLRELLPSHASVMSEQQGSTTLRQLLTMTSGITGDDGGLNVLSEDAVSQILTYGNTNDPGVAFEYSNAGAQVVAAVLREAIERPILEYAREKLFDPLSIDTRPAWQGWDSGSAGSGFTKPGFGWATDRSGLNIGAFGLKLTAPDMVKIGELYVNGGRWQGRRIVSEAWAQESTTPKLTPEQSQAGGVAQYGYLWWVGEYRGHAFFEAAGSFYQKIACSRERRLVVVVTAADDESSSDTLNLKLDPILDEVIFNPLIQ
jgi:CubicO group peptidase (beta-lactamase class C family)